MRQAFEDIPLASCDLSTRTAKRILRGLRGFAGKRRMAGWWIYRKTRPDPQKKQMNDFFNELNRSKS